MTTIDIREKSIKMKNMMSQIMLNMAIAQYKQGNKVIYMSLEMEEKKYGRNSRRTLRRKSQMYGM